MQPQAPYLHTRPQLEAHSAAARAGLRASLDPRRGPATFDSRASFAPATAAGQTYDRYLLRWSSRSTTTKTCPNAPTLIVVPLGLVVVEKTT